MADTPNQAPRDDRRVVNALGDLFDQIPPDDVFAAQQELHDAGIDPTQAAERVADKARAALGIENDLLSSARLRTEPRPVSSSTTWLAGAAIAAGVLAVILYSSADRSFETPPPRVAGVATPQQQLASVAGGDDVPADSRDLPPLRSDALPDEVPTAPVQAGEPAPVAAPPVQAGGPTPGVVSSVRRQAKHDDTRNTPADTAADRAVARDRVDELPAGPPTRPSAVAPVDLPEGQWLLDAGNWERAAGLLPEPVLQRVRSGDYWYRVDPMDGTAFRANYPKRFWDDSRANQGRFAIDATTCGLVDVGTNSVPQQIVGFPFPAIDKGDTDAACRVMWNLRAADGLGGGQGSTFSISGFDPVGETKRIKMSSQETHYLTERADNPENLRWASLTNVLEPSDIDGVGGVTRRTNDWTTPDKAWFFVPATRRVRRVGPEARSQPIAGLAIYAEDLGGFSSKIEYFKWRLVGEGEVLASVAATAPLPLRQVSQSRFEGAPPVVKAAYEIPDSRGVPWHVVDGSRMVPRPVWIVEGHTDDPQHQFGKVILYIDREMYRIYWKVVHDRAGAYFYNAMFSYYWSRNDARSVAAVMPAFIIGVNDLTNRATIAGRPSASFVEFRPDRDMFTLRTLTRLSD